MTLCSIVSRPLQALLFVCICLTICVEAHRETPLVLSNGVTAYVRTSEGPKAHACLHVVAKGRSPAESKVWSLEPSHGGFATVEPFFASCAEEIRRSRLRQEVGVIAVGSFDRASMEEMIAHHFSSLPRVVHDATPLQVRYLPNRLSSMVAVEFRDPATEGGLEEMWKQALCLQVLQSYAECAVRDVGGVWIHAPFAHFYLP